MTQDDQVAVRTLLEEADRTLADRKAEAREQATALGIDSPALLMIPRVDAVKLVQSRQGKGEIYIFPHDHDSMAWAAKVVSDTPFATIASKDLPKVQKYVVFVPNLVPQSEVEQWFGGFTTILQGHYAIKKTNVTLLHTYVQKNREGEPSGYNLLFTLPEGEVTKLKAKAISVPTGQNRLRIHYGGGHYELRPRGVMMAPLDHLHVALGEPMQEEDLDDDDDLENDLEDEAVGGAPSHHTTN